MGLPHKRHTSWVVGYFTCGLDTPYFRPPPPRDWPGLGIRLGPLFAQEDLATLRVGIRKPEGLGVPLHNQAIGVMRKTAKRVKTTVHLK